MSTVWRNALLGTGAIAVLFTLGITGVYSRLPPPIANTIAALRSGQLSRLDRAALERGYYEDLQRVNRFNSQLWEVYMNRPADWLDVPGSGLTRLTGDFIQEELFPAFVAHTSWADVSTNRWGMRDKDYEKSRPEGTFRIALLGASLTMGWGVQDDETYEALVEERLNREHSAATGPRYEILNFAAHGYSPLQQMASLNKALEFAPNAVFVAAHRRETARAVEYLIDVAHKRIEIPYPYLREVLGQAGVDSGTSNAVAARLLEPYRRDILGWAYGQIVAECKQRGIVPMLIMFDERAEVTDTLDTELTLAIAKDAGFIVLDLGDVYDGHTVEEIRLAEWDQHPNALGHRLIAEHLYTALMGVEDRLLPVAQP